MPDPYASHLPVLRALASFVPMRRVLEFGAGRYSTPFFLSVADTLVSVESDATWRERVASEDPRHTVTDIAPSVSEFDFVFIDDGREEAERLVTIERVLGGPHPVVAIHDAEVASYGQAIRELAPERSVFVCVERPHTAVVWPPGEVRSRELLSAYEASA